MQNRRSRSSRTALSLVNTSQTARRIKTVALITAVVLLGLYFANRGHTVTGTTSGAKVATAETRVAVEKVQQAPFPTIDTAGFTKIQLEMLDAMREEYAKQPVSFDRTVLEYTEGAKESWCADFISVIRVEAGKPFINQETGYWRIPGVQSLQSYYASSDAYHFVGMYTPKFGDVAFYFGETPDGSSQEHVAFVLEVRGDVLVTLGGNETEKGILQIRSNKLIEGERGLSAFGESSL